MHGLDPSIEGAILLSPPLRFAPTTHLDAWAASGKPLVALVPELDDYLRPDEARAAVRARPAGRGDRRRRREAPVGGGAAVRRVLDEIVAVVAPGRAPLPRTVPASLLEPDAGA